MDIAAVVTTSTPQNGQGKRNAAEGEEKGWATEGQMGNCTLTERPYTFGSYLVCQMMIKYLQIALGSKLMEVWFFVGNRLILEITERSYFNQKWCEQHKYDYSPEWYHIPLVRTDSAKLRCDLMKNKILKNSKSTLSFI